MCTEISHASGQVRIYSVLKTVVFAFPLRFQKHGQSVASLSRRCVCGGEQRRLWLGAGPFPAGLHLQEGGGSTA